MYLILFGTWSQTFPTQLSEGLTLMLSGGVQDSVFLMENGFCVCLSAGCTGDLASFIVSIYICNVCILLPLAPFVLGSIVE